MKNKTRKQLALTAKILSILYISLITLLAFDTPVFSIGFLIHLVPSIILIVCLFISWKISDFYGGILFIIAGIGTLIFFKTYKEIISFFLVSLPPLATGTLFLISSKKFESFLKHKNH